MIIYDRVLKIAIAGIGKRDEETYFLDWNAQFLIAVQDFISETTPDIDSFIQADQITNHVIEKVNPPFRIRTETIGKLLDRESILIERRVRWFKDDAGKQVHKTGWRIDVARLNRRVSKYKKFLQTEEELKKEEKERLDRDIEKQGWGKLPEDERLRSLGEIVVPKKWEIG